MCSRYSLTAGEWQFFSKLLQELLILKFQARYNIAPTQSAPAIVMREGAPAAREMRFGFQTPASAGRKASIVVNARSETAAEKPMFRDAFRERRCLIPATGFYEWQKRGLNKQPMNIRLADGEPFYFAGLWRASPVKAKASGAEPEPADTFVIMTTEPNRLMAPIHNRMPVILDAAGRDRWLDEGASESAARELLRPFDADSMESWPVGAAVGSPGHESEDCLARVEVKPEPVQQSLFDDL